MAGNSLEIVRNEYWSLLDSINQQGLFQDPIFKTILATTDSSISFISDPINNIVNHIDSLRRCQELYQLTRSKQSNQTESPLPLKNTEQVQPNRLVLLIYADTATNTYTPVQGTFSGKFICLVNPNIPSNTQAIQLARDMGNDFPHRLKPIGFVKLPTGGLSITKSFSRPFMMVVEKPLPSTTTNFYRSQIHHAEDISDGVEIYSKEELLTQFSSATSQGKLFAQVIESRITITPQYHLPL